MRPRGEAGIEGAKLSSRCATLWIGKSLGAVERACLSSMVRQGHAVDLYCYDEPLHVPDGITLRDAAPILPRTSIIRHHSGSVALFSNRFRYELLRRGLGTWLDCDAYLLKPIDLDSPYLMGEFEPGRINTAVLRIPPDSPLLPALLSLFEERQVPPWLPFRARIAARWRRLWTGRTAIDLMPWGSLGPEALTALAPTFGLDRFALPQDVLYPVRWQEADWIVRPDIRLEDRITERTAVVHLWNERIKHFKDRPAPPGSFLARIQAEGQV